MKVIVLEKEPESGLWYMTHEGYVLEEADGWVKISAFWKDRWFPKNGPFIKVKKVTTHV